MHHTLWMEVMNTRENLDKKKKNLERERERGEDKWRFIGYLYDSGLRAVMWWNQKTIQIICAKKYDGYVLR